MQKIHTFLQNNSNIYWLLIVSGLVVYLNALPGKLFWDAEYEILENAYIKDWSYIHRYFTESLASGSGRSGEYWRPMLLLLYSIEWHLWNSWSVGFHFVNICVHLANSILIFNLFKRLTQNIYLPVFLSLIFLLHPIQTESVTYITGIADPLAIFFLLLSIHLFINKKHKYLSYILFIAAFMTKEISLIFPAIVTSFLIYKKIKDGEKTLTAIKNSLFNTWPFYLISGIYMLLRLTLLNFGSLLNLYAEKNEYTENISIRIFTFLKTIPMYIKIVVLPQDLHMEYDVPWQKNINFEVLLGLVIIFLGIFMSIIFLKKKPEIILGCILFFLPLIPVSGIFIPANAIFYEHWMYLPIVGFFLIVYSLFEMAIEKSHRYIKTILLSVFVLYVSFLSIGTIKRNFDYINPITFYNNILKYNQNSLRVWNNLGMAYAEEGDLDKSNEAYRQAINLDPKSQSWPPHHNLANNYKAQGKIDEAIVEYKIAMKIAQNSLPPFTGLADLYIQKGDIDNALIVLREAEKVFPENINIKQYIEILEQQKVNEKK